MDLQQSNHLKAYGVIYNFLKDGNSAFWLLNYRGGSFFIESNEELAEELCIKNGVTYQSVSLAEKANIEETIKNSNMDKVELKKAPKIAVYTPKDKRPWDDAVTLALTYADISYDKVYDNDIMEGKLKEYDWLHLHHEDFTGQMSKFYESNHYKKWYKESVAQNMKMANKWGFNKISLLKQAVAYKIRDFVANGGFMFAMCLAPVTLDISLATKGVDICGKIYDGDSYDKDANSKLDFSKTFAFENFKLNLYPYSHSFANIDYNQVNTMNRKKAEDFMLFDFSAKYDPIPTILVQNHTSIIKGYFGLATSFNANVIKKNMIILGRVGENGPVYYLHGKLGKGRFTFLGGHDPEDYSHMLGDPPTRLKYHPNSPGYRLILNNILFPAVKKKHKKT